jgi:hypothetical protein
MHKHMPEKSLSLYKTQALSLSAISRRGKRKRKGEREREKGRKGGRKGKGIPLTEG